MQPSGARRLRQRRRPQTGRRTARTSSPRAASTLAVGAYGGPLNDGVRSHIVRHDPAAVLRRIVADRKTLAEHPVHVYEAFGPRCKTCRGGMVQMSSGPIEAGQPFPCASIRNLAEGWGWTEETP